METAAAPSPQKKNRTGSRDPSAPPAFRLTGVTVELGGRPLLRDLDLRIDAGSFVGILGPNGSGKTTLLRTLLGRLQPALGSVEVEGRPPSELDRRQLALRVGVVPQTFSLDFRFSVREVVGLGRYPHWSGLQRTRADDDRSVTRALERLSLVPLAERPVTELSGGERQRVLIAQTLAQDTPILLLDEPLNNLDLNHQLEVMELLRALRGEGRTVVVVLHDINMAAQYCEELIVLDNGQIAAHGRPADILTPELILEVFETRVAVHRESGRPYVTPLGAVLGPAAGAAGHRVHVIAGGGAGTVLIEELIHRGFFPSVGIVSVFDSDYQAAERYGLSVVSTPPFQPLEPEAIAEQERLVDRAESVIVAPQVYGKGNLANLETAVRALESGKSVLLLESPPVEERDLANGRATALTRDLLTRGATRYSEVRPLVEALAARCRPE